MKKKLDKYYQIERKEVGKLTVKPKLKEMEIFVQRKKNTGK